ncbi:MAG: hypothetical protein LUF30_06950, partial [Lachnospiraceae bacterium]|nr:hypothetical protein [Lachnospiraceae bacterium]
MPILFDILKQFSRTWHIGLVLVLVCGLLGYGYAWRSYTPSYQAKASFLVSISNSGSTSIDRYYNRVTTTQLSATFPYILTSGALSKVVAEDLGVSSVPGTISASMLGDTNIFQISVTASDGQT